MPEWIVVLVAAVMVVVVAWFTKKEKRNLNLDVVRAEFPYPEEIDKIIKGMDEFLKREHTVFELYPPKVNPHAFAFAVRQAEGGRPGLEFGVLSPEAINTDFDTQYAWFLGTFRNDTIRWHNDTLMLPPGDNRTKEAFEDFLHYFGTKYCPPGAANDPNNLNKNWIPNVREFYARYTR